MNLENEVIKRASLEKKNSLTKNPNSFEIPKGIIVLGKFLQFISKDLAAIFAGRILASTPLLEEAVVTRSLPLLNRISIYTRFGDVFAWACLTVTLFAILLNPGRLLFRSKSRLPI